ncbi:cupredoxin domain-containing protein [Rhodococcus sp. CH91]|uniref:cupredoxin domain-containing protein n=1 Tax=Rhodococcus sp. CH91 TaxID=2910256 RepID=UPI001F4A0C82|nr:plastocyanin/azurin family copper-binding protein [Rhodococcus sp. CH91]
MRRILSAAAGVTLAAALLTGCGGSSSAEPAVVIEVKNMAYSPAEVTIDKGRTVRWQFDDSGLPHDVAGDGALAGELKSDLLTEGTYEYTFEESGTYTYHCTPHPAMVGTVIVR